MGKKHKGKPCAYCFERLSETADHVFARNFFLPSARANLPQVPACSLCNAQKSALEHYLTSVLPFGGRHKAALPNLKTWCRNVLPRMSNFIARCGTIGAEFGRKKEVFISVFPRCLSIRQNCSSSLLSLCEDLSVSTLEPISGKKMRFRCSLSRAREKRTSISCSVWT